MSVTDFNAELATEISQSIRSDPGTEDDSGTLLAALFRDKFAATTMIRLVVANLPEQARSERLFTCVDNVIKALAAGDAEGYVVGLGELERNVREWEGLSELADAALEALRLVTGIADGTQPPLM